MRWIDIRFLKTVRLKTWFSFLIAARIYFLENKSEKKSQKETHEN